MSAAAFVAAVIVVVLIPLADLGIWAQRNVVGTGAFNHLADRVLEQTPVRREVTDTVVAELDSEVPELAGQTAALRPIVGRVLSTSQVRRALAHSLSRTHTQLREDHDPVQLDLNPVLPIVRQRLPASLATEIPADVRLDTVTVLRRHDAPAVWTGVELVQNVALATALLAVALLLFAVFAARRRAGVCVVLGIVTTVTSLVLIALVEPGRSILEHEAGSAIRRDALRAGYYTVLHSFVVQTIILAIVGVVLTIVGVILARWGGSGAHSDTSKPTRDGMQ
jgi:hypothetical protein